MLKTEVIYDYNATEYLNKDLWHEAYLSRVSTRLVIQIGIDKGAQGPAPPMAGQKRIFLLK